MSNRVDPTQLPTGKVQAFQFPPNQQSQQLPVDPYSVFNELLDLGLIACVVQFKKLKFGVKHFFVLGEGWIQCVVEDEDLGSDDIRITIKQGLPMMIFVITGQFTK